MVRLQRRAVSGASPHLVDKSEPQAATIGEARQYVRVRERLPPSYRSPRLEHVGQVELLSIAQYG
jgi:hypothetical protein